VTDYLRTWIGSSDADHITIGGLDLASEVMGHFTLTELAFYLTTHRRATEAGRVLLDAVLVALADHGLTPSALSTRLTYTGAPEAPQAAIAAGLLGAGSVFLGPAGDTAQFLADALSAENPVGADEERLREIAFAVVEQLRATGRRVPGLGHPVHKVEDPRAPRLYELAAANGGVGPHLRLLQFVADANTELSGRRLPINGAGAGGAVLVDLGVPPSSVRAFVLIARTAGLVAHLAEEAAAPIGRALYAEADERSSRQNPAGFAG
jgi:citrate synthase